MLAVGGRWKVGQSEVGKYYGQKGQYQAGGLYQGDFCPVYVHPGQRQGQVQVAEVDEPGDKGPGLLGVPGPIGTPCLVGPYGPCDQAKGEEGETKGHYLVGKFLKAKHSLTGVFPTAHPTSQEQECSDKGYAQCAITNKVGNYVDSQPVALEGRHEGLDGLVRGRGVEEQEHNHYGGQGAHYPQPVEVFKDKICKANQPGIED